MSKSGVLVAAFLTHLPRGTSFSPPPDLEGELAACLAAGRAAWPEVQVEMSLFMGYLAERVRDDGLPPLDRVTDLYLACGCALAVDGAHRAFDRAFRPEVERVLARAGVPAATIADVLQTLAERLLVRTGEGPPRIAEYAGRSRLRTWLATVARRAATDVGRRKDEQPAADPPSEEEALAGALPDVALLKARFKAEFESAIRLALERLPARERTMLLLHLVDGVTLPRLASMQRASRATVARWLASAREMLQEETRRELVGRLRLSPSEYESVAALVRSQLDLSVARAVKV